jgi:hypothetical protein
MKKKKRGLLDSKIITFPFGMPYQDEESEQLKTLALVFMVGIWVLITLLLGWVLLI